MDCTASAFTCMSIAYIGQGHACSTSLWSTDPYSLLVHPLKGHPLALSGRSAPRAALRGPINGPTHARACTHTCSLHAALHTWMHCVHAECAAGTAPPHVLYSIARLVYALCKCIIEAGRQPQPRAVHALPPVCDVSADVRPRCARVGGVSV